MTDWHASDEALLSWVDGTAGPLTGASVEQHVGRCERCRGVVASLVPADDVPGSWESILEAVELEPPSLGVRLMTRVGVGPADRAVVDTAPMLRIGWVVGVCVVLGFAVVASLLVDDGGLAPFLALAPLVPVAGVAVAYGPSADPSYEAVLVAPYPMSRLVLLRTVAVLATSLPLLVLGGLLLPFSSTAAVAWLVPAAGCTVVVLAASSWVDPEYAAVVTGLGWVVAVAWASRQGDPLLVVAPLAMAGYALVLVTGLMVLGSRLLRARPSWRLL